MSEHQHQSSQGCNLKKERGLSRELSTRQMAMIAIGGRSAPGFSWEVRSRCAPRDPAVIVCYLLGAVMALLLMGALSEMAVAHPTAGSFGVYAELYVNRWAGFVVRYTYWACQCIAIGGEATAVAIYCRWWFPQVPPWAWIVLFSSAAGQRKCDVASRNFGEFEYWFAMIKVVAILAFIGFGRSFLFGFVPSARIPASAISPPTEAFSPMDLKDMWMAMCFVIFSYIGTEVVAVTAGEARNPDEAVPRAMKTMVFRLILFYIGAMIVLVGVVPWSSIQPGGDVTASPFVRVFQLTHIPAATHLMNFVVLTAALSSMNCDLYLATRMMFSLARGGYAPKSLGPITKRGVPLPALLLSTTGLIVATVVAILYPILRLCLFVRNRAIRRPVRLDDDFLDAPVFPPGVGSARRPQTAGPDDRISVYVDSGPWTGGSNHCHQPGGFQECGRPSCSGLPWLGLHHCGLFHPAALARNREVAAGAEAVRVTE